ncbi:MAG: C39 family peptidase [Pseudomonadota bacterium]|nr:C39 family peptidase [Pseudomonadota bacterium]
MKPLFSNASRGVLGGWLLATALVLSAAAAPARAQVALDMTRMSGPGATPVLKQVRTLRDMRYRDLVQQKYDFSCGSAALASLLQFGYGIETDEVELITRMMEGADPAVVVKNGFSMLDMKRHVGRIGMRGHGFRVDAAALYRLQMPVIALLDLKGYKHFVVVKGAGAGRVFVADPALGHRVMPEADFVAGWNGIVFAVVGDRPMRTDTYLVNSSRSPALEQRVGALERATSPPRVVEFGLVHVDLF